jgi:transcriptional regulator with XRE-family HTH domain
MSLRLGVSSGQKAIEQRIDEELSRLTTQVTNEADWYMRERKLTRADLASRMGVSPGRVSQVLSGGENLTLRTLASLAAALDAQFEVELKPRKPMADSKPMTDSGDAGQRIADADNATPGGDIPLPRAGRFEQASTRGTSTRH